MGTGLRTMSAPPSVESFLFRIVDASLVEILLGLRVNFFEVFLAIKHSTVLCGLNPPLPIFLALNQGGVFKEHFPKMVNLDF